MLHRHTSSQASCLAFAALFLMPTARVATAATYTVDRFDDSLAGSCSLAPNDCSLRGALLAANAHPGDDVIVLAEGFYELARAGGGEDLGATGDLDVLDTLLVRGTGPETTVIDANHLDRVFEVRSESATLTLRGLTLVGGRASDAAPLGASGLGVRLESGSVRVENCWLLDNSSAGTGYGGRGGAISDYLASGTTSIEIVDSWLYANGSASCAAIHADGHLLLERSTVSHHTADAEYVICIEGANSSLVASTVTTNVTGTAQSAAAVKVGAIGVSISGCTLANNTNPELRVPASLNPMLTNNVIVGDCGVSPPLNSQGGNVESPGDTCLFGASDMVGVADPMLEGFGWRGGPTPVHRPLPGSPVLDLPNAAAHCGAVDQRGLTRPCDGGSGAACDAGAVELYSSGEIFVDGFECGYLTPWSVVVP